MSENGTDRIVIRRDELPPEIAGPPTPAEVQAAAARRVDALSKLALVLGVLSILFAGVAIGPIAMIVGLIAALRTRGDGSRSQSWAIGGIVTGTLGTIIWIGVIFWMLPMGGGREAQTRPPDTRQARVDTGAVARSIEPIRNALRANVKIVVERREGIGWSQTQNGSGTFVSLQNGRCYFLTCRHVVERSGEAGDARVRVYWIDGRLSTARVEWMGERDVDLAILSAELPETTQEALPAAVPLGVPEAAGVGEPVFAIGNPLDYDASLVTGVISAVRTIGAKDAPVRIFQAQIPLNPGNSGGGLYTAEGKLIGVNSWTLPKSAVEGIGFAISIENLSAAIAKGPAPVAEALRRAMPPPPAAAGH